MPPAAVFYKVAARTRSVATALHLAGIRTLARVRAGVHHQCAVYLRSEATALNLAGIRALARVHAGVRNEAAALLRGVATPLYSTVPCLYRTMLSGRLRLFNCSNLKLLVLDLRS